MQLYRQNIAKNSRKKATILKHACKRPNVGLDIEIETESDSETSEIDDLTSDEEEVSLFFYSRARYA